jgi:hypothetical protein
MQHTKESRLKSRQYQFDALLTKGYKQETFKGVDFFTFDEGKYFTLKVFWGTGANDIEYVNYRSAERRAEVIQNYKNSWDRKETYKAEQKAKGYTSSHAGAAAAIKAELKGIYPHIKFSVTSESFSMGDSVHVKWTDGPTDNEVDNIIKKYQYGSFNGMEDLYENTNSRDDIPQSKYVSGSRSISDELEAILLPDAERLFTPDHYNHVRHATDFLRQIFYHCSIPAGVTVTGIVPTGETCGISRPETFYTIGYTLPETAQQPQQPNFKPVEVIKGEINIIDYSVKAFAVIGDTKPIKDKLKELGGSFNPRLSCGAGWIFSKKRLDEVTKALSEDTQTAEPEQPQILELPAPQATESETIILETPQTNVFKLDYFKIIWHEGHQNPNFENTTFTNWEEVQKAFVKLWEVNEKGQDGGYSKVKCEIKFTDQEVIIDRIDITDRINNGDFNPSQMHIVTYLQSIIADEPTEPETPQYYETLPEIQKAAKGGKVISLFNLSQLVNNV